MFSIDTKFGDLIVHNENVLNKLSVNFFLMAVFEKVALEITKRAQHCVYPDSYVFMCFGAVRVYLRSEDCKCTRVICKRMSNKTFSKTSKK